MLYIVDCLSAESKRGGEIPSSDQRLKCIIDEQFRSDGSNDIESKYQTDAGECHFQSVIIADMLIWLLLLLCCCSRALRDDGRVSHLLSTFFLSH